MSQFRHLYLKREGDYIQNSTFIMAGCPSHGNCYGAGKSVTHWMRETKKPECLSIMAKSKLSFKMAAEGISPNDYGVIQPVSCQKYLVL